MARPLAEKVLDPGGSPDRWEVVASKLYDGTQGRRSSYGFKIFPAIDVDLFDEYPGKANEAAEASPFTD